MRLEFIFSRYYWISLPSSSSRVCVSAARNFASFARLPLTGSPSLLFVFAQRTFSVEMGFYRTLESCGGEESARTRHQQIDRCCIPGGSVGCTFATKKQDSMTCAWDKRRKKKAERKKKTSRSGPFTMCVCVYIAEIPHVRRLSLPCLATSSSAFGLCPRLYTC